MRKCLEKTTATPHIMNLKVGNFCVICFAVFIQVVHCHAVDPDVFRNITQLITSKGYPCEDHSVTTSDDFILGIQRIPHGVHGLVGNEPRPVVYLQHGLLCDSTLWVTNIVKDNLAFLLADAGFDVWLGNSRGNTYSRRHKTLSPKNPKFWDWSWDEMAQYDIPAVIDYIINTTGQQQLYYIGHSQGTLIGFSAFSQNQQIAKKVKLFIALAPVAYLGHTKTPLKILAHWPEQVYFEVFGDKDFLPSNWFFKLMALTACKDKLTLPICTNVLFLLCGYDYKNLNQSRLPVYVSHSPAGTSVKNMIHYSQAIQSGKYQNYDYGPGGNKQHYGQATPPQYNVSNMRTPVVLYSAVNDWLADPKDVSYLKSQLHTRYNSTEIAKWNHLDFAWGIDAGKILYSQLVQILKNL